MLNRQIVTKLGVFLIATVLLVAIFVRLWLHLTTQFFYEDAYITFRYAENLAAGQGFVYNVDERVLGTTTPLFTLLLALMQLLGVSVFTSSLWLGLLGDAAVAVIIYLFLRGPQIEDKLFALLGAVWVALSPPNVKWSISGMETGLFTFLSLAVLYAYWRKRLVLVGILAGLLVLCRVDGIILLLVLAVHFFLTERHIPWRPILVFGLITVPWFVFAAFYFGTPIPNTVGAKLAAYSQHQSTIWPNFQAVAGRLVGRAGLGSNILAVFAIIGIIITPFRYRYLLPMLAWFFAYFGLFILSRTHLHPWYLVPPLPVWLVMAALGVKHLTLWLSQRFLIKVPVNYRNLLYLGVVVVLSLGALLPLRQRYHEVASIQRYENTNRKPLGLWLKTNTPSEATVFLEPIGYIGYYSERYIYDDMGLVSPQMIPFNQEAYDNTQLIKKIEFFHPDYLVVRPAQIDAVERVSAYRLINSFEIDQKIVKGDPNLLNLYIYARN